MLYEVITLDPHEQRPLAEIANQLWATELLRGSRLLVLAADDHDAGDPAALFWRVINRVDWSRDLLRITSYNVCYTKLLRRFRSTPGCRTPWKVRLRFPLV